MKTMRHDDVEQALARWGSPLLAAAAVMALIGLALRWLALS